MTYTLLINRDGNDIMQREITADDVVDILTGNLMTPIVQGVEIEHDFAEEEEAEPVHTRKKYTKREKSKGGHTCSKCGEKGHNAKTCPNTKPEAPQEPAEPSEPLSETEYDDIHTGSDHGLSVKAIADEMSISLREVNRALQSSSYQVYINRR